MSFPKENLGPGLTAEIKEFGELTLDDGVTPITLSGDEVAELIAYLNRWQRMVWEKWRGPT